MSRVAKKPINLPKGVELNIQPESVSVKGPKGTLSLNKSAGVEITIDNGVVTLNPKDISFDALTGTVRSILANMVKGVSEGFEKKLELVGVGYRAAMQGKDLNLSLGFSHPVVFVAPEGITLATPTQTEIVVQGADKQVVGEVAAKIRGYRPPEPYKGKGVKYAGENIIRKEAKKA
ncbi:50S ribosomal protein L6 [Stenotrophomonas acidaminiphila]|uniref:50S ribosomal protein L6 n=1 Tax=Stenotrophomonas TaxID=40323 RepID=UPI000CDC2D11|nr:MULTISPECIES: 50S ribosomal protein L6 [Stenotrophomonas]AUZ54370.1 50S ribosomal protein L6 [Stenotrophomonas acidaminiphila]MCH1907793.1 50S ribosomal protein L6 [Stenotrophomonas sp. Y6]MPS35693.1 50S ribosomal protein L6 [Stenotrophomonas sp.]MTI75216.1 50S ribosomal protein L6 [Stenotrophomonas sp.]NCT86094.1 50S ribosomal protein L6 [Stenotrophomonas acidaminiphila]